jgi:hypothetical protein
VSVFGRIRSWFAGPAIDRTTQREVDSAKEKSDLARLSQTTPEFNTGTVTPDRTPRPD